MSVSGLKIAPDPQWTAEIVLLVTSLGAKRTEFLNSKWAKDLLEIKRAHFKVIDFNKDIPCGKDEEMCLKQLCDQDQIYSVGDDVVLPQIFIEGYNIGDADILQEKEDSGQLSYMLWQTACPACFQSREPTDTSCTACKIPFLQLLPNVQTFDEAVMTAEPAVNTNPYDNVAYTMHREEEGDSEESDWSVDEEDEEIAWRPIPR